MKRIWYVARVAWEVVQAFLADKCTFLAAGLCYFLFFSLFPFLLLVVALTGYFLTAEQAMAQASQFVTQLYPQQGTFLLDILEGLIEHRGEATLVGLVTLLWSAKNVFVSLGQALNVIFGVELDRGPVKENVIAIALALGLGAGVFLISVSYALLMAIITFRYPFLGFAPSDIPGFVVLVANLIPVTLVTLTLMGLYRVLPNLKMAWHLLFPGALTAAALWEVGRRLFAYYLENMARLDMVYGSISGIVGLLIWVYLSAILFLLGAEVSWVLAEHHRRQREGLEASAKKLPLSSRRA